MGKKSLISCTYCSKQYEKENRYIKRNLKLNRDNFCSRQCLGKYIVEKNSNLTLNLKSGKDLDSYSRFRRHVLSAKSRAKYKNLVFDISVKDLYNLWENQCGKCAYTKIDLINPSSTNEKMDTLINRASLDRIDSNLGYTVNNIQWVSLICQYAKNKFSDSDMKKFILLLKSEQKC